MQEKEETAEIIDNLEKKQKIRKILVVAIISVFLAIVLFSGISAYFYLKSPEKTLGLGANIESVLLNQGKDIIYIKLTGGINEGNITKIKFIFTDENGNNYNYETSEGIKEIEVPFERSFWDWLFGKSAFTGKYNYEINSSEIGLNDFNDINEVSVSFEYGTETGGIIETPVLDTTRTTNQTTTTGGGGGGGGEGGGGGGCTDTCSSLGHECGNWTVCENLVNCGGCGTGEECTSGQCTELCEDECSSEGLFCDGNMTYNCSKGGECFERTNLTQCTTGQQCVAGVCEIIPDCDGDEDCVKFDYVCSVGICNATGKCEISYNTSEDLCRAANGSCDVADYCSGKSELCLPDVLEPDGTNCPLGVCSEGECVECLNNADCNDGISCTIDTCDLLIYNTCEYTPVDDLCLNGNWCNGAETCNVSLGCQSGTAPVCNDGKSCTIDTCREGTAGDNRGDCYFNTSGCSCTTATQCNDSNPCTDDACVSSKCVNTNNNSNTCDDGFYCTVNDYCSSGICLGTSRNCEDGVSCTINHTCNEVTNLCDGVQNDELCEDGISCTDNFCGLLGCFTSPKDARCLPSEYCNLVFGCQELSCKGTDISCGIYPACQNCNSLDGCFAGKYRDYYCSGTACSYIDITKIESDANGNCNDGKDNDCDGNPDGLDTGCTVVSFPTDYLAYWKFDSESGSITPDETGNHDGLLVNDALIKNDVLRENVASFDGDGDYIDIGAFDETENLDGFTVSFWVKSVVVGNDSVRYIFEKISNMLMSMSSDPNLDYYFFMVHNDTPAGMIYDSFVSPNDNKWHHIVLVYNGTDVFTYMDMTMKSIIEFSGKTGETTSSFTISGSFSANAFNGSIDDFMVYGRALSQEEIQEIHDLQLVCEGTDISCGIYPACQNCNSLDGCFAGKYRDYYCGGISCSYTDITQPESDANGNCMDGRDNDCDGNPDGLDTGCTVFLPMDYLAYWKFDIESGGITPDETGIHDGILVNDAKIVNDPERRSVATFDGDVDFINVGVFDETENLEEFTVSLWVKAANADDTITRYVFDKPLNMYMLRDYFGNYLFGFYNDTNQHITVSDLSAQDTNWHHIVAVYNGTDLFNYIDMTKSYQLIPSSGDTKETDYTFTISGVTPRPSFNGSIDDFMVYDRALSQKEIRAIYDFQSIGMPSLSLFSRFLNAIKNFFSNFY